MGRAAAVVLVLVVLASGGCAGPARRSIAETPSAMDSGTAIELVAETVSIELSMEEARVQIALELENPTSSACTVRVGLPTAVSPRVQSGPDLRVLSWGEPILEGLTVEVDRGPAPDVTREDGSLVWTTALASKETRRLIIRYAIPEHELWVRSRLRDLRLRYSLAPGAGWASAPRRTRVVCAFVGDIEKHFLRAEPAPSFRDERGCVWVFDRADARPDAIEVAWGPWRTAADAVAVLRDFATKPDADWDLVLDYAENLEAAGELEPAARAFVRLHALEVDIVASHGGKRGGGPSALAFLGKRAIRGPPELRAAVAFRAAGLREEARAWEERARSRLSELRRAPASHIIIDEAELDR